MRYNIGEVINISKQSDIFRDRVYKRNRKSCDECIAAQRVCTSMFLMIRVFRLDKT